MQTNFLFGWAFGIIIIIIFIFLLNGCAATRMPVESVPVKKGDYSHLRVYISQLVKEVQKEKKITGMSIVMVDDQDIVYNESFGYAIKSEKIAATPDTLFGIGSVSKLYTAMAVMKLAGEGKIDLDKPIKTYLKDFSIKNRFENLSEITVRQLLTHHSGLPGDIMKGFIRGINGTQQQTGTEKQMSYHNLSTLLKEEYTAAAPDSVFAYSNLGYSLLGEIVSRVSGMPFEEYVKNEILDPIGMKESTFVPEKTDPKLLSHGYINGKEIGIPLIRDIPAGQMVSSANEMALFLKMIFAEGKVDQKSIISKSTLYEMLRIQNSNVPKDGDFHIGLAFWEIPVATNMPTGMGHGGDLPPFRAVLIFLPKEKLGVVILVNSIDGSSVDLTKIAVPALQLAYEVKSGQKLAAIKAPEPIYVPNETLKKYEGTYATSIGPAYVRTNGGELELELLGSPSLRGKSLSDGSFAPYYSLFGIIPIHVAALDPLRARFIFVDKEPRIQLSMFGLALFGTSGRISATPVNDQWMKRIGEYEALNPDPIQTFESFVFRYDEKDRFFYFEVGMNKEYFGGMKVRVPINTISDYQAISMGEGRNLGETIRVEKENGEEVIYYSGFHLKKKS